jgi:hypothetical protein
MAKQSPGPPMTLGNMRQLGVNNLLVSCLNPHFNFDERGM